jgi:type II secretory pathway component PulM
MNKLIQYWKGISDRERVIVSLGFVAVVGILAYAYVWVPWHQRLDGLRQQVPAQKRTLAWMENTAQQIKPYLARSRQTGNEKSIPILTVIDDTANASGLRDTIRQIQPGNDSEVKVWFQDVGFDGWLGWVARLQKNGVFVSAVSVTRSQTENTVNVRVTLKK